MHEFSRRNALEARQLALGDPDAGNIGALVAEQKLGIGPAAVLFPDAVLDRHSHVLEPHLVDLMAAVQKHDGPYGDTRTLHIDQQKRDPGLLLGLAVRAHQTKNPVGELTERIPGLLAVDDVAIPVPYAARFQRCQIRPGTGFRISLAPPFLARADLRQESLLLGDAAESHDHRRDHLGAEWNQAWTPCQRRLFLENVLLHRVPTRTAEFHRPTHAAPAALMKAALPLHVILPAELVAIEHL